MDYRQILGVNPASTWLAPKPPYDDAPNLEHDTNYDDAPNLEHGYDDAPNLEHACDDARNLKHGTNASSYRLQGQARHHTPPQHTSISVRAELR